MAFADIIGQEKALALLRGALANNRLHHAYLFTGPEGVGKRTTAIMMAMALHCAEIHGDSCGHCIECARIRARNHPDVREIEPLPGKKEITIQQIRDIEKELQYRSFSGGRKIAVVDPAALLNHSSQNALLKTLEEPPENSVLILVSPSAGALLPTLRSRCLRVSFGPIPRQLLADFLSSRMGYAREEAQLLAALSMGSLGVAVAMQGKEVRERRHEWVSRLTTLTSGDYRGAMDMAEALASSREEALEFLRWVQSWYRDLLLQRFGQEDVHNLELLPELQRKAAEAALDRILSSFAHASDAAVKIHRNLNRRMVLEQLLFGAVGSQ
jgi:DNA polymerase III subunit delta'